MKYFIYILLFVVTYNLSGQSIPPDVKVKTDSLYSMIKDESLHDTTRAEQYNAIVEHLHGINMDTLLTLSEECIQFINNAIPNHEDKKVKRVLLEIKATALTSLGYYYKSMGDLDKGLSYYEKVLKLTLKLDYMEGIGNIYNSIAGVYNAKGDVAGTLTYLYKALEIAESIKDSNRIALITANIGYMHTVIGEGEEGIKKYLEALSMNEVMGNWSSAANNCQSIASVLVFSEKVEEAKPYLEKALHYAEKVSDLKIIAGIYLVFGNMYNRGKIEEFYMAIDYYKKAVVLYDKLKVSRGVLMCNHNIGQVYYKLGNVAKSKKYANVALSLAEELKYPEQLKSATMLMSKVYEKEGNWTDALKMYKIHIQMRDSLKNEETQKASIRQQTKYEFEKAQIVKENEAKEQARILAEETSRRNNLQYSLIFLGILVLFVIILMLGFIKVSPNVAEGLIFFAFLILFEFALVFTEPYLEQYTNDEPMYNLLANSVLAILIFPVHAILEKLLKKRIVK